MLVILLLLGVVLAVAFTLNKEFPLDGFSWVGFIKANVFAAVVNLIVGIILIMSKDDLELIFPITKLSVAIIGFAGGMLWQGIVDSIVSNKKTAVGINKKD